MATATATVVSKQDLVDIMAEAADISKIAAGAAFEAFTSCVTSTLKEGGKVTIVGFGGFETSDRAARTGRNPQTGEPLQIPAMTVPKFKAGKKLKDAVNGKA